MDEQKKASFRRNYYTSDDSGKVFLASILTPLIFGFLIALICGAIGSAINLEDGKLGEQLWYIIPASLCGPLAFMTVYLAYNKLARISYGASNIKFKMGWKNALICIAVAIIALFGLQFFISGVDHIISLTGYNLQQGLLGIPLDNFGWFILNVILLAILPAIFEELIFRGVILTGLRNALSDAKAIVLSALLFALMHTSLQQFVYPLLFGLILGWVVVRTGSTVAGMIVHFTNNFLVVLLSYIQNVTGWSFSIGTANDWWFWVIAVVLLLVTGLLLWIIDRFYFKRKNKAEVQHFEEGRVSLFVWIAIIVGIILLILSIIMNFVSR